MNEEVKATVIFQRTRVIVKGYAEDASSYAYIPNMVTVWDNNIKRYIKDKTFCIRYPDGTLVFPRTIDTKRLFARLEAQGYTTSFVHDNDSQVIEAKPYEETFIIAKGIEPRNRFQKTAIDFLCNPTGNDIKHIRLLSLPVGQGKTFCAIAAMAFYKTKTLIVCNSLIDQWRNEILQKTSIKPERIYSIKSSEHVKNFIECKTPVTYDVYLGSLRILATAVEQSVYERLCKTLGIGLKIIDEFHIAPYTQFKLDAECQIAETIYLSATAMRSNSGENKVFQLAYRNMYSYGDQLYMQIEKYLNCIYIFYDTNPKYYEITACTRIYGFDVKSFAKHLFDPKHLDIILTIIKWALTISISYTDESEKIVVIMECIDHIIMLKGIIAKWFPDIEVGDYSSNVDKSVKQKNLTNKIILSTNKSFGTGLDFKDKLRVVISTITYESPVTARQLPGRLRQISGKEVYYIDLVNKGFKRTYDHYINRSKIINMYAKSITYRTYGVDIHGSPD